MKKIRIITLLTVSVLGMAACSGHPDSNSSSTTETTNQAVAGMEPKKVQDTAASALKLAGEALLAKSDCGSCHKTDAKTVGPSFKDIAAKYDQSDATVSKLTDKVIKGGSGIWGETAMPPHPGVEPADLKEMVKYILSLKK